MQRIYRTGRFLLDRRVASGRSTIRTSHAACREG